MKRWIVPALAAWALLTLALVFGDDALLPGRAFRALWNFGHVVYFALITALLLGSPWLRRRSAPLQWTLALGLSLLLGGMIEVLQIGTARSADVADLLRDLTGTLLVLAFWPGLQGARAPGRMLLRALAAVALLWTLKPLAMVLIDEYSAARQFPVLADFSAPFELSRWQGDAGRERIRDPRIADHPLLRLKLRPAAYSGVDFTDFPADWRGYRVLRIDLYLPGDSPLSVTLRVHDRKHERGPNAFDYSDRFNRSFRLQPGRNRLTVPLDDIRRAPAGRELDLSRIVHLGLFAAGLKAPAELLLIGIRLVP